MPASPPAIRVVEGPGGPWLARDDVLATLRWLDQQGRPWPAEWSLRVAEDWIRLAPLWPAPTERKVA